MNLLKLIRGPSTGILAILVLGLLLLGAHAVLDLFLHQSVGGCVLLDVNTKLCLVSRG